MGLLVMGSKKMQKKTVVGGWCLAKRNSKHVTFVDLALSSRQVVQCVVPSAISHGDLSVGAAVTMTGLMVPSPHPPHTQELKVTELTVNGPCSIKEYPLQNQSKKRATLEHLRLLPHLRQRLPLFGAISRIRHHLLMSIHRLLSDRNFTHVHTPALTMNDCEGGAEVFHLAGGRQFFN